MVLQADRDRAREAKKPSRQEKLRHLDAALSFVKSFRLAIDVGAHVGNWTKVMASRFERVLAFEPYPPNQERWRRNMEGVANATLVDLAVGDENSYVRLQGEKHSKHFCIKVPGYGADSDGRMIKLDDYAFTDLDFLKVDTEGADALVLKGAAETIRRCRPVVIVESVPRFEARYGLPEGAPMKFLESLGAKRVWENWRDYVYVFPEV